MNKIDNFKRAAVLTVILGVLLITAIVLFIFGFIEYYYRKIYFTLAAISFLAYLIILLRRMHYFAMELDKGFLIIRFYNPHPFVSNYRQIKIKTDELYDYQIKKGLFGQDLIIKIKQGNRIGKYPPVSITALTREQKKNLIQILNELKQNKQVNQNN